MAADLYRSAAPIYDACTALWSGGAIWRSRLCQIEHMRAGQRILYPGGGTGRAAVAAAKAGMRVTLVDRSPAMLARARSRAAKALVEMEFLGCDVRELLRPQGSPGGNPTAVPFDGICANHFFNVFGPEDMQAMRGTLLELLRPGGNLYIADFRPLAGGPIARSLQRLHHAIPLGGCRGFTRNAMHPIYDHSSWSEPWQDMQACDHRAWRIGPGWYRTWVLRKPETDQPA